MIPTFVISLKTENKRRKIIADHLKSRGFDDFEIFDAVNGYEHNVATYPGYNAARRLKNYGRHIQPGELGCLLSHKNMYAEIVKRNLPHTLILEDDVSLSEDAKEILEAFIAMDHEYDMIRLLSDRKIRGKGKAYRNVTNIKGEHNLIRLLATPGGAYATLISQTGAQKLLKSLESFDVPIDMHMGRCWEYKFNNYSIFPSLAQENKEFESGIGNERFDKTPQIEGMQRRIYPIKRFAFRVEQAFGKRYWFLKTMREDKLAASK